MRTNYKIKWLKQELLANSNGSLRIEGDFEIVDKDGNVYGLGGREIISICRCGLSNNKPFCDGSHKGISNMKPLHLICLQKNNYRIVTSDLLNSKCGKF